MVDSVKANFSVDGDAMKNWPRILFFGQRLIMIRIKLNNISRKMDYAEKKDFFFILKCMFLWAGNISTQKCQYRKHFFFLIIKEKQKTGMAKTGNNFKAVLCSMRRKVAASQHNAACKQKNLLLPLNIHRRWTSP